MPSDKDGESSGEFHLLDLEIWEVYKPSKGTNKDNHPIVSDAGNVYIGSKYAGDDIRVFVRKQKQKNE